jgi:hypothetical protein
MVSVRTLREEEPMPQHLGTGFEAMPVMKSFCWVAEQDERIIGMLMAAPCHGLIFLVRLRVAEGAPVTTTALLFRHCMRDAKAMGFIGYFSYIDPKRDAEAAMIPICTRAGGFQINDMQVPLVGSTELAGRF